jgi:hypothetical protein
MPGTNQRGNLQFYFLWQPFVIIIQQRNPLTARFANSNVPGFAAAYTLVKGEYANTRLVEFRQSENRRGVGSVDYYNDFEVVMSLAQRAAHRTTN